MKKFIGIDISQKDFKTASPDEQYENFQIGEYENAELKITEFISTLDENCHCIIEATGNYSLLLSCRLYEAGHGVSVINPKASVHFRKLMGQIWKDDANDAKMLSLYGQKMNPKPFVPASKELMCLKQKSALLRQLKKQKQALGCFLHSLSAHPYKDESVEKMTLANIEQVDQQIDKLQKVIADLVAQEYQETEKLIRSVKGIGPKTSWALIEATGGFQNFESPRQFAKFIGIAPTYKESGTSVRMRSQINRSGDPQMRALLYICTWSAIQYNKACRDIYLRLLAKGKPGKVALVAVMNKLIRQVFAVVKKQVSFDNDFEENLKQKWTNATSTAEPPQTPQFT